MEAMVEEKEPSVRIPKRINSSGNGSYSHEVESDGETAMVSPVHAFGMAELLVDVDDLLQNHLNYTARESRGTPPKKTSTNRGLSSAGPPMYSGDVDLDHSETDPIAYVAIVTFDLRQGPHLVCVDPPIEEGGGLPRLGLTAADLEVLTTEMPFKALPENGLASNELSRGEVSDTRSSGGAWAWRLVSSYNSAWSGGFGGRPSRGSSP
ncbi:unnamed protein product, partial [Discosporangium mesarthrocarpum]